jgi:hypothetical protein
MFDVNHLKERLLKQRAALWHYLLWTHKTPAIFARFRYGSISFLAMTDIGFRLRTHINTEVGGLFSTDYLALSSCPLEALSRSCFSRKRLFFFVIVCEDVPSSKNTTFHSWIARQLQHFSAHPIYFVRATPRTHIGQIPLNIGWTEIFMFVLDPE